ncbi:MAG: UDP-N-acetylmuramoyl-L-alanyl-D-glutamate--2,6-diaminopimelate ligase, partial [Lachnospiraceae bacterium]|nr:UDP-N-acetylmuramoyl-L-alanyl-D-glutamate--2,6-diaminopimelate ligase [Lachnospiraceae bacterium]
CKYCVMEVSSQAFKLNGTYGITFDYGGFLNISPDHIGPGEHEDFEEYFEYKKMIFDQSRCAVINIDDEHGAELAKNGVSSEKLLTVSTSHEATLYCDKLEDIWEPDLLGSRMHVKGLMEDAFVIPMPGRFNAENALVAAVITKSCNVSNIYIEKGLRATTVKGRTQVVREASHIATFIIDYAHNALSMESLLSMLKGYKPEKLICLFGGGGNKPKQRRYDMGAAAGKYADLTILTEDNPRYEEIENINNDIIVGLDAFNGKYEIILDRKEAIEHLIDTAKPGYIVALIGKGHETYQDVKGVKTYFCEEEIIRAYVKIKS